MGFGETFSNIFYSFSSHLPLLKNMRLHSLYLREKRESLLYERREPHQTLQGGDVNSHGLGLKVHILGTICKS